MSSQIVIIGAGSAKGQDYIRALLEKGRAGAIKAIVVNKTMPQEVQEWAKKYNWKVILDGKVNELFGSVNFDTAIIALPHDVHFDVTMQLLNHGIYIIKEKPLAMNMAQVEAYKKILEEKKCKPIFTTVQRSTHPLFVQAKAALSEIGKVESFTYKYTFNLKDKTSGWRSDPVKSGGGVVLDMGYHALDVVLDFFGIPKTVQAKFNYKHFAKEKLEDAASVKLKYDDCEGQLLLDRHAEKREERLEVVGKNGKIVLTPTLFELKLNDGTSKKVEMNLSKTEIIHHLFQEAFEAKHDQARLDKQWQRSVGTMRLIDLIYAQK